MKEKISFLTKKREFIYLSLFLCTFLIAAVPIIKLDTLVLSDELGTIVNSSFLAGDDWAKFISSFSLAFYKYGIAIFYFFIYLFTDDPTIIYQYALLVCAAFISVIPIIVYRIEELVLDGYDNNRIKVIIAFVVGCLPTSLLWSKSVWAESLVILIPWLQLLILLELNKAKNGTKRRIFSILLPIITIIGYSAHQRGISILLSALLVVVFCKIFYKKDLVDYKISIFSFGLLFLADYIISYYLRSNIWGQASIYGQAEQTTNTLAKVIHDMNLDILFSPSGIKALVKLVIGWIYSLICSTYGLFVFGGIICIVCFVSLCLKIKKNYVCSSTDILIVYSVFYFLLSFCVGILFFFPAGIDTFINQSTDRLDKIVYCRYVCSSLGPIILIFFVKIISMKKRQIGRLVKLSTKVIIAVFFITLFFITDNLSHGQVSIL